MLKDLLNRPDAPSGDVQFRVPVLFWWFYFVVILGFAGVAAYVLVTQELSFWVLFLEAAFLFSIYRHIRERPRARCFVVTDEGIEQRGSRRRITLRWHDIVEATVRSHSLIVASAKNRITIPRGLPRYAELYSIIDSQAPSTALGTVSGRPLHFYYRSSLAFWHLWMAILTGYGAIFIARTWVRGSWGSVLFGLLIVGFFVWCTARALYLQSFRYEFHEDRISVRSWLGRNEYSGSELRDAYLELVETQEGCYTRLKLIFAGGDLYTLADGNLTMEELHRFVRFHYLPERQGSPNTSRPSILAL